MSRDDADESRRRNAAIEAMAIEAGLIAPPPNYDPEEAAREGGYTRDEIKQAVAEAKAREEADEIAEAEEEASQDPRRH